MGAYIAIWQAGDDPCDGGGGMAAAYVMHANVYLFWGKKVKGQRSRVNRRVGLCALVSAGFL